MSNLGRASLSWTSSTLLDEIPVDLRRNQAPFEQGSVAAHRPAQGRLAQETRLERSRVVGILAAQRVERRARPFQTRLEHAVDERGGLIAEDRPRSLGGVAGEVLDDQTRHQQGLEPVPEAIGEKTADPEAAVEEIGGAEREGESEPRLRGVLVSEPPAAPRGLDQRLGVAHQRLERGRRCGAPGQGFEDEHPFLIAERNQSHRQALVLGQLAISVRIARPAPPSSRPRRVRAPAAPTRG